MSASNPPDPDPPLTATGWMAVRRASDDGHEWLDVRAFTDETDKELPGWAAANPVIRIAQVIITETPDEDAETEERDEAYERAAARSRADDFAATGGKDWT
jgi:hypothetical protein